MKREKGGARRRTEEDTLVLWDGRQAAEERERERERNTVPDRDTEASDRLECRVE